MSDFCATPERVGVGGAVVRVSAQHGISRRFEWQESLVEGGMTSLAMVDLMLAVECEFALVIPDQELTPANFASISSIVMLVERLLPAKSGV